MALRAMTGRGRHHGHRGGPYGGFGPDFQFGPRRRRRGRGDVRAALLVLLAEEPRNGYGLMQEIEARSDGAWRPSPGSVYPALSQLEDEGLVRAEEADGRKLYRLTDAGETYVEENRETLGTPWETPGDAGAEQAVDLRGLMFGVGGALMQIVQGGDPAQIERARAVLKDARRSLYAILAEDEPGD
jgi:DNA-binding PadR family transcriptional regulator